MNWMDIASIVFVCVTANHLGLVKAIEGMVKTEMPIVNCPKCLTFWVTLAYCCDGIATHTWTVLAVSFLASYLAIWLELMEGYIDTLYMKVYEKIYSDTTDGTVAADADEGYSAGSVSEL